MLFLHLHIYACMSISEVYFSQGYAKFLPPSIIFNNKNVLTSWQKHPSLVLDTRLSFSEYVNQKTNKCNRILGPMKRLSLTLSRKQLLTIYKTFLKFCLDSADIFRRNLLMMLSKRNWKRFNTL